MSRPVLIVTWVLATALTTVIAWQIVAAAGEQVSPGPLTPVPSSSTSSSSTAPSTSTSQASTSTTSTTTPGTTSSSTTSTTSSTTPTATTAPPSWQVKSIPTSGGTVVVSYRPDEVVLDAATPAPGYSVEVEKQGPPDVDVEFEGNELGVRVRVKWDHRLVIEVDESD